MGNIKKPLQNDFDFGKRVLKGIKQKQTSQNKDKKIKAWESIINYGKISLRGILSHALVTQFHPPMQKIYTPEQVAQMLQLHPLTVTKYIKKGKLQASRIGRIYRITEDAVQAFLEEMR